MYQATSAAGTGSLSSTTNSTLSPTAATLSTSPFTTFSCQPYVRRNKCDTIIRTWIINIFECATCMIQAYNAVDRTTKTCGIYLDDSPLTESWADADAVPALKVTVQLSLIHKSFSRSRWRRPLSNVTISALGDSLTGFPSRSQQ